MRINKETGKLDWLLNMNHLEKYAVEGPMRTEIHSFINPLNTNYTYICGK